MAEYWLQKKTIGGWSMVTWYAEKEEALANLNRINTTGQSGYSWRVMEATIVQEIRLEEETQIEAPELEVKKTSWGATIKPKPVLDHPKSNGWGSEPTHKQVGAWMPNDAIRHGDVKHGMVGKVWMLNHQLKERARVNPDEVESRKANGWIVSGPKTAFEG